MTDPTPILQQVANDAIWYYVKLVEEPPSDAEWADPTQRGFYKYLWVVQQLMEELESARADVREAHTLEGASGESLREWARFHQVTTGAEETDEIFRNWIKFAILKHRCVGNPDGIKLVAAAFLTLLNDPKGTSEPIPWHAAADRMAMTQAEDVRLEGETAEALSNWPTLTQLYFNEPQSIPGQVEHVRRVTRTDEQPYPFTFDSAAQGFDSGLFPRFPLITDKFYTADRWTPTANATLTADSNELWLSDDQDASTHLTEAEFYHDLRDGEQSVVEITMLEPAVGDLPEKGVVIGGRYCHRVNGGYQVDSGSVESHPFRERWRFEVDREKGTMDWFVGGSLIFADLAVNNGEIKLKSTGNSSQVARFKDFVYDHVTEEPRREVTVEVEQGLHDSGYEFEIIDRQLRFDDPSVGFDRGLFDVRVPGGAELDIIQRSFAFDEPGRGFDLGLFDAEPTVLLQQGGNPVQAFRVPLEVNVIEPAREERVYAPERYDLNVPWSLFPDDGTFLFDSGSEGFDNGQFDMKLARVRMLYELLWEITPPGVEAELRGHGFSFDRADKGFDTAWMTTDVKHYFDREQIVTGVWDAVNT